MLQIKQLLILSILMLLIGPALSGQKQKLDVIGVVVDTQNMPLVNATVIVIRAVDTSMLNYGLTNTEGKFKILNLDTGKLIMQINFLGFDQVSVPIDQDGMEKEKDIGTIKMEKRSKLLDEITVTAPFIPIQLKDDTIEYHAEAFKVEDNAIVEKLLRKLPGIELNRDGTIKSNGEQVFQILVDGEEFFGNDPKFATKNLPADAIAKIQVFKKKSDMAKFSEVDDGNEKMVINLKLKEDRKNGFFGKISAGYGNQNRYSSKFNLNRFRKGEKVSFFGRLNNINQNNPLNINGNFSGGANTGGNGGGGGFSTAGSFGINYNRTLSKSLKLRGSYSLSKSRTESDSELKVQNFLTEEPFIEDQTYSNESKSSNHRFDARFDLKIDTSQSLRLRVDGNLRGGDNFRNSSQIKSNFEEELLSASTNIFDSDNDNTRLSGDVLYRKKFRKTGRNFSVSFDVNSSDGNATRRSISLNEFFLDVHDPEDLDSIWQYTLNGDDQFGVLMRSTFTESIFDKQFLSITYTHRNTKNDNFRDVYELLSQDEILLGSQLLEFSNSYDRRYQYDQGKLLYRINHNKINLSIGVSAQKSRLVGKITSDGSTIKKIFVNVLPEGNVRWKINPSKSLRLDYITSVREPSLRQLQPFVDNSNPLNVFSGNPDLRPSYRHSLGLNYNAFQAFSMTNFFARFSATVTQNPIVLSKTIDSFFRQSNIPVNVDKSNNNYGNNKLGKTLKSLKLRLNISPNSQWAKSPVFVNGRKDTRVNFSAGININLRYSGEGDFDYGVQWNYRKTKATFEIDQISERAYETQTWNGNLGLNFLKNWRFLTNMNYSIYAGEAFEEIQKIPIWNVSLSTKILPNDRLQLKASLFDLLNRNQGVNRSNGLNTITEERVNALSRYFLVTATWSVTRLGK